MKNKKEMGKSKDEPLLGYASSVIATMREPFLVLDKNLRVITANQAFYTTFEVAEKDTILQPLPDLGNRQWNIPELLKLLKEIVPEKKVVKDYEVEHKFEHIGKRVMCLNTCQLHVPKKIAIKIAAEGRKGRRRGGGGEEEEEEELILLAIGDITKYRQTEKLLRESEEHYRKIIGSITGYIYTVAFENGRPVRTTYTPECYTVTGYTSEELNGDPYLWINMVFADDRRLVTAWAENIIKSKKVEPVEHRIVCKDGSVRWIRNTAVSHFDDTGKLVSYDGVIKDITDEVTAQGERSRANALDMIIQGVPDVVIVTDTQGKIVLFNQSFMDKFGYGKEVIGKMYADYGIEEDRPKIMGKNQECLKKGSISNFEFSMSCKDGRELTVLEDAKLLIDTWGNPQNIIIAMTDITDRKKAERTLLEVIAMKENFTTNVSHELRTPLGALKESIALVLDGLTGAITEEQKKYLNIAKQNIDRLARLINDVLDFKKLDSGNMVFRMVQNDINKAIRVVHDTMLPIARKKGLDFILKLDDRLPKVKFDTDKIIQVLTNLVNNALKVTQKGGITIASSVGNNNIQVLVQDTGFGIKEEDIPRLFKQFEQLGKKSGGTGLGLAISKDIIMAHNGKIWVESTVGQGTIIHFVLPIEERRSRA